LNVRRSLACAALSLLFLLLPFEPRVGAPAVGGTQVTLLEAGAVAATAVLLWAGRSQLASFSARPPLPLVFLGAYAAAHVLSAVFAPEHVGMAAKFSLRMVSAALFATAVASAPPRVHRCALFALVASAAAVACLALGEGLRLTALDTFLDLFRERVFSVAADRRATGGVGGPNEAAAFLAAGLVAGAGLLAPGWRLILPVSALISIGLLFTYSRSGLVAAVVGLALLGWARQGAARRGAIAAAGVLAVLAGGFVLHPAFRDRLGTELAAQGYDATYAPADTRLQLNPGERRTLAVELVNTGRREWTPAVRPTLHALVHEWPPRQPAGVWRLRLTDTVPPGGTVHTAVTIEAPVRTGTYLLVWDLFTLPSGFLSTSGVPPALVPFGVGVPPPERVSVPELAWRRGRLALWRLALLMWRDRPVTGVGSDNFRRLHPRYGGWLTPGNYPMTAHNQFLEAAANTGTIGLLALIGTLAFSLRAALAGLRGCDAALAGVLIGLLGAFATQALVDSLLEFTGSYLLFGFVVGAVTALGNDNGRRIGDF